ncbi:pyroglutamyl-peptidase I [Thermophilibacter provencensis]|uniref:Pyrrolidone-carboxylate peptidase n=1 Tax=Thermophilibacter provencensis TaxID=1852386 RepID=A0ABT7V5W0_9ACTN|nr:pyroglutamyl-peptidase I [Thermophilibacter provencensis]MDM8271344.1 pyroglutamyl-peptidase I [Thermophilibacter provencensis]
MKVLVTGFEPFGGATINPALEAVMRLPNEIAGAEVVTAQIPVVFGKDAAAVAAAIDAERPDVVLCVGQAGGRSHITPEFVGINYANARIPDNEGNQPIGRLEEDGPDAYFATLPVFAMVDAARAAGVPAAVSYTAGTFCCNEVLYELLHTLATRHLGVRGGFVHVPYATEQAVTMGEGTASMSVDMMVTGLTAMIEAAVTASDDAVAAGEGTEQ